MQGPCLLPPGGGGRCAGVCSQGRAVAAKPVCSADDTAPPGKLGLFLGERNVGLGGSAEVGAREPLLRLQLELREAEMKRVSRPVCGRNPSRG